MHINFGVGPKMDLFEPCYVYFLQESKQLFNLF